MVELEEKTNIKVSRMPSLGIINVCIKFQFSIVFSIFPFGLTYKLTDRQCHPRSHALSIAKYRLTKNRKL